MRWTRAECLLGDPRQPFDGSPLPARVKVQRAAQRPSIPTVETAGATVRPLSFDHPNLVGSRREETDDGVVHAKFASGGCIARRRLSLLRGSLDVAQLGAQH